MSTSQASFGRLDHRLDGWWITGLCCQDMGPYRTQEEARDDLRGVQRFYRETSKEKPRALFHDLGYAKGQLDLFDTATAPEVGRAKLRDVVQKPIKQLPMPRKQLENAVLGVTSLYDLATLRGLSDSRLLELWERFK